MDRLTLVLALMAALPAAAAPPLWRVDPDASEIVFEYLANGLPQSGAFRRATGEGTFDPAAPDLARLRLDIDVASLDLGDPVASAFALSAEWFDAANHPAAVYRLSRLEHLGGDVWLALGDVTIRGRTRILETPLTLTVAEDRAEAQGSLTFDRRDFGVGVGPSALFVSIADTVSVRFDVVAHPIAP